MQRRIILKASEDTARNTVAIEDNNTLIGYAGEHQATIIGFDLPESWLAETNALYQIYFLTSNGLKFCSDALDIAEFAPPSGVMVEGNLYVQLVQISSSGDTIKKTEVCKCTVGKSVADGEVIAKYDGVKLVLQLTEELQAAIGAAKEAQNNLKADISDANGKLTAINEAISGLQAFVGYTNDDILGLQVDFENRKFTRLAGAVGLSSGADFDRFKMYGGRKRCNVLDDGTITAYYGDEGYKDDGSSGQVMVYQPKFYYRVVPLKLDKNTDSGIGYHIRKANYYVSATPHTGFKLHPAFYDENGNAVDYILYSAYEGSLYSNGHMISDDTETSTTWDLSTDYLCSVANVKPISGLYKLFTRINAETLAKNHGTGWHIDTVKSVSANQLLMMIELGTMNTQAATKINATTMEMEPVIGLGVVNITDNSAYNCASFTGSTATLGNTTGMAESTTNRQSSTTTTYTENGKVSVSYRGIENPWGNIWKFVNGINIWGDGTMGGGQPYVADDFDFIESKRDENYKAVGFTLPNTAGSYINAIGYGNDNYDWLLMPSEVGGSSNLPVGDMLFAAENLNGYCSVRIGGHYADSVRAGGFCLSCKIGANGRGRNFGGRLVYVPSDEKVVIK